MTERVHGRGAAFNPGNRFERLHIDELSEEREPEEDRKIPTLFFHDTTRSIFAKNDSPDVPFTFSVNPYRGCEHGCIYCYARPTHEFLGFSAGLDFESKIMVKKDAPQLLEEALRDPKYEPQVIALSGKHGLLSAGRTEIEIDASVSGNVLEVPKSSRHRDEERDDIEGHRYSTRARKI